MLAAKKGPASGGPGAGQVACGWPRWSKLEARDFPYVAPASVFTPIDKNAEPNHFSCGRGVTGRAGRDPPMRAVRVEKHNGPAFGRERNKCIVGGAAANGTKRLVNNLSAAVFGKGKTRLTWRARFIA
jgi:hypothetical protein